MIESSAAVPCIRHDSTSPDVQVSATDVLFCSYYYLMYIVEYLIAVVTVGICHCCSDCVDVDECAVNGTDPCDENAHCSNTAGSFKCRCDVGFTGTGRTCDGEPKNELMSSNLTICLNNTLVYYLFGKQ